MKHIRWIAVVGLIAIVELQYVWLVNTYKLTRENVMRQSHELFKDAALKEAFDRIGLWKELHGKKDSTYTYRFDLNEDVEDDETQTPTPETRQFIESAVFIAIQEGVSNTFKMDVSLHNLDSIYAHMLDSVGISAKVSTCMTDSLGNVLRASSPQAKLEGQKYLRTRLVPINRAYTRYLQGVILNPYWVIFQRMTLLLIATVLIMVLVIKKRGEERMLTAREADLLRMLCEHKGQIVRREVILSRLWNTEEDYFASRSLDVFVSRLRKLLVADDTVELKTVKGVGLMLEEKV